MLKLTDNPSILTPHVSSLVELTGTWWVARTKSRYEKSFAWDLLSHGIGYFLPMREKIIFSGGRKRKVMMPLFPLYVFFCGNESDRYTALTTNRITQTIEVTDQQSLIEELAAIEKALLSKAVIDEYPQLPTGSNCRIKSGPMMGIEGVVVERNNEKSKMVLGVSILGQGALIEIHADLLEPA
jgi:transcription antitermination factor NusG